MSGWTDELSWRTEDEVTGDVLPESVYQALRDVSPAAVRRAFPACDHRDAIQLYADRDICPRCGKVLKR